MWFVFCGSNVVYCQCTLFEGFLYGGCRIRLEWRAEGRGLPPLSLNQISRPQEVLWRQMVYSLGCWDKCSTGASSWRCEGLLEPQWTQDVGIVPALVLSVNRVCSLVLLCVCFLSLRVDEMVGFVGLGGIPGSRPAVRVNRCSRRVVPRATATVSSSTMPVQAQRKEQVG